MVLSCHALSRIVFASVVVTSWTVVAQVVAPLSSKLRDAAVGRKPQSLRQLVAGRPAAAEGTSDASRAGGRNLQVLGRLAYEPVSNEITGVDSIYYEVRDDDTVGHSVLWSGHTDANGCFDTGVVDISDDDSEPDLYLYFETTSSVVTVEDGDVLRENYYWSTFDTHIVEDFAGTFYDFGTLVPSNTGVGSNVPALNAFHVVTRAQRMVQQSTGSGVPHVNVLWPSGDEFGFDYDGDIILGEFIQLDRQILHLYAHHLERSAGMAVSANNACSNDCQFCEDPNRGCGTVANCSWCPMTQAIARSEAFAVWFPTAAQREFESRYAFDSGEPYRIQGTVNLERFPPEIIPDDPFDDVTDLSEARAFCGADVLDNADRVIEAVAAFLEDLADAEEDDHAGDGLNECSAILNFGVLRAYLLNAPGNVLTMIDQMIADNPSDVPELYSVANNISPVYTARFPEDTDPPGIVLFVDSPTHPDNQGATLPCIATEWASPLDDVTGACGYSYTWWTDPEGLPADNIEDFVGSCVSRTDGPFNVGEHYLTLRAVDCAGHWAAQDRTFGPFEVLDCNGNGTVDVCDIDCNHTGYEGCDIAPAFCDVTGCGLSSDCNDNLAPDECDIADGTSEDCNGNGIPDECEDMGHWGGVSGSWHTGSRWEELTVPGDGYHICVEEVPGDVTAVYAEGTHEFASLSCSESLTLESRDYPAAHAYLTINEGGFINGDLKLRPIRNDVRLTTLDTLDVNGLITLDGGTLNGPGTVHANGGINVVRGTRVEDKLVELHADSESSSRILIGGDAVIHNNLGMTWDILADGGFINQTGGTLVNDGVIRKTVATGSSQTNCAIENAGTFSIETGTLSLWGITTSTGSVIGAPGTVFELYCGRKEFMPGSVIDVDTFRMTGGNCGETNVRGSVNIHSSLSNSSSSRFTFTDEANIISYGPNVTASNFSQIIFNAPAGDTVHFNSLTSGILTFNSPDPIVVENLSLSGNGSAGGIMTTGPITVNQLFTWNAGATLSGPGVVNIDGEMVLPEGTSLSTLSSKEMSIAGLCTMNAGFRMLGTAALNILPTGTIDFAVDTGISGGSTIPLSNAGRIVKSGGDGTATITTPVTNTGIVEVLSGTLRFARHPYAQTAGETILNGGDLESWSSNFPIPIEIQGGVLRGTGLVTANTNNTGGIVRPGFSVGDMLIDGAYTQAAPGVLEIELEGTNPGEFDVLEIMGDASLAGELQVMLANEYVLREGDVFVVLTAASINGEFDTFTAPPNAEIFCAPTEVRVGFFEPDDFDHDGDTDLPDFANFQLCFGGPNNPPASTCPSGVNADIDGDGDVDADDYAAGAPATNSGPQ